MNDTPETLRKRRRAPRKSAKQDTAAPVAATGTADTPASEPVVQAILEQALHPDPAFSEPTPEAGEADAVATVEVAPAKGKSGRRAPRKRASSPRPKAAAAEAIDPPAPARVPVGSGSGSGPGVEADAEALWGTAGEPNVDVWLPALAAVHVETQAETQARTGSVSAIDRLIDGPDNASTDAPSFEGGSEPSDDDAYDPSTTPSHGAPPTGGHASAPAIAHEPGHYWVYLAFALFVLALGFGLWGVWTTFFASGDPAAQNVATLRARSERLSQEVSTLRRSDQISREANRDLERTLAERDEEIAGLRADIAFYESFVGATGQRRGLNVHDLDLQLQGNDAWHFVATLTQNLNRGAVNSGRLSIAVEGTRDDRLERLSWSSLRKLNNAPGIEYSFKYFQQVEGELMLPPGFKPLRISVRLAPAGGNVVEQSFSWTDTVKPDRERTPD